MHELQLDSETMRRLGYAVVDRLVDWQAGLRDMPVSRSATRAETEALLRERAPANGTDFDTLLDRLFDTAIPLGARVDHPRFFAFVPGNATWPGALGDFIAAGVNVFQGTWLASAGVSQLELVVLDWFKEWIGYPDEAAGLLVSGGSAANLTALACARRQSGGGHDSSARIYFSAETHSSFMRAVRILGFHDEQSRIIPCDGDQRMSLDALAAAVAEDRAAGLHPVFVVANGGTTSTGSVDPLEEIATFCRTQKLWLHVDAAYGGFAVLTERGRAALRGLHLADSVTLDPHKWLYQPFEAGCLIVRQGDRLRNAFHVMPDYLRDTAVAAGDDMPVNFAERGVQLTRSARAIKIWLSLQYFGVDAFRNTIDDVLDLARHAQTLIEASPDLELLTPARLGIVCFRRRAQHNADAVNERLVQQLAASGTGLISSTRVNGKYALRMCVLSYRTTAEDVETVIDFLRSAEIDGV